MISFKCVFSESYLTEYTDEISDILMEEPAVYASYFYPSNNFKIIKSIELEIIQISINDYLPDE